MGKLIIPFLINFSYRISEVDMCHATHAYNYESIFGLRNVDISFSLQHTKETTTNTLTRGATTKQ